MPQESMLRIHNMRNLQVVLPTPPFPPTNIHFNEVWSTIFRRDGSNVKNSSALLAMLRINRYFLLCVFCLLFAVVTLFTSAPEESELQIIPGTVIKVVASLAYPEGELGSSNPHWIFRIFWIVLAKYAVQALLLYSLNPKFCTKNVTLCMLIWISHFASASGGLRPLLGLCPWIRLGPRPLAWPPPREPHLL